MVQVTVLLPVGAKISLLHLQQPNQFYHVLLETVIGCMRFSSSTVQISSTVQVEALGVVSMDTKQLAQIQNRTRSVAYLQALGANKSLDDSVSWIRCARKGNSAAKLLLKNIDHVNHSSIPTTTVSI